MSIRLTSFKDGNRVALDLEDGTYTIGGRGSDIELDDPALGGPCAEVVVEGANARLRDLGTESGTYVNGYRAFEGSPRDLANGDRIQIGEAAIEVETSRESKPTSVRLVLTQKGRELAIDLADGSYVVGRDDRSDIVVPDPNASGRHLELVVAGKEITVRDLGSTNGTRLNLATLPVGEGRPLRPGDQLEISRDSILTVEVSGVATQAPSSPVEPAPSRSASAKGYFTAPRPGSLPGSGNDSGISWWLFSLEGRLGRTKWWLGQLVGLFLLAVPVVLATILAMTGSSTSLLFVVIVLGAIPCWWASIATSVKRFHDQDFTGWMVFIGLVPMIGSLVWLVMCGFLGGTPGPNRFGSQTDSRS